MEEYHKTPNAYVSAMKLKVDMQQTMVYLNKQMKLYKMLLNYKISPLPEYFHPYAKLHYKRAYKNELPESVRSNEKHMFHLFHRIGYQKSYARTYEKFSETVIDHLEEQFEAFEDEQHRFEKSSEQFYYSMEMLEEEIYIYTTKNDKKCKNTNTQKNIHVIKNRACFHMNYHDDTTFFPHLEQQCSRQ